MNPSSMRARTASAIAATALAVTAAVALPAAPGVSASGTSLTTPSATTIEPSTPDTVLGDHTIDGYDPTDTLLVNLSLSGPSGTTFSLPTTTGLVRSYGYSSWTAQTELGFTGSPADAETALDDLRIATGTEEGTAVLTVDVTSNEPNTSYFADTGHFYRYVADATVTATSAATAATATTLKGRPGYVVTITSQVEQDFVSSKIEDAENIWIGASDATTEGGWVWTGGPEEGQALWEASCVANGEGTLESCGGTDGTDNYEGTNILTGTYSNWCAGEPNNSSDEDHAVTNWSGGTCWNDLGSTNSANVGGYVVEYGDAQAFTGVLTGSTTITVSNDTAARVSSVTSSKLNGTYGAGEIIPITVNFSQDVDVDTSGGHPSLELALDSSTAVATYVGGSGTGSMQFEYVVAAGQSSPDLGYTSISALSAGGAVITKTGTTDAADLVLPAPGSDTSLAGTKDVIIDAPAVPPSAPSAVGAIAGDGQVTVNWTGPADDGGAPITSSTATSSPDGLSCTVAAPGTSCTVVGLTNATSYTFTVTATNGVGTSDPSSQSTAVTPEGTPTALTLAAQPGDTPSGATMPVTSVQVVDDDGVPVTTSGTDVTVTVDPPETSLGGTTTVATDTDGIATFDDLTLTGPTGDHQLTFTATGLTPTTSTTFTLHHGTATTITIETPPTDTTSGDTLHPAPAVEAHDSAGNPVTAAGTDITVTATGPATLGGTTTVATDTDGIATFDDLTLTGPTGDHQLTFTATGLTPTTSTTFTLDRAPQAITFAALADRSIDADPTPLTASATSGLPVSFEVIAGNCRIDAGHLVVDEIGPCSVTASQDGDDQWAPAEPVTHSFTVTALATPDAPDSPDTPDPNGSSALSIRLKLEIGTSVTDGDATALVAGAGLVPGSPVTVELHSTPQTLTTGSVDDDGTYSVRVTFPADIGTGEHALVAIATGPEGPVLATARITVGSDGTVTAVEEDAQPTPTFTATEPTRLLDSRTDSGPLPSGEITRVDLAGRAGVPHDATAVMLTVTAVEPGAAGYATVFPCGDVPGTSNLNHAAGQTVAATAISALGADGSVCVFTSAPTGLLVDVTGWYGPDSDLRVHVPSRAFDTRSGPTPAGGETVVIDVAGRHGVPADAATVVVNVTAVESGAAGFLTVHPCGATVPPTSSLNHGADDTVANLAISGLGADGTLCVTTSAPTDVVVDVIGWYATSERHRSLDPVRVHDSRDLGDRAAAGSVTTIPVAGVGALPDVLSAVAVTVTVTGTSAPGHVTVFDCGDDVPPTSTSNHRADDTVAMGTIVGLDGAGRMCVLTSADAHLVADVTGYVR